MLVRWKYFVAKQLLETLQTTGYIGRQDLPSNLSLLKAKLDLDPTQCKLEELNHLQRRFFSQLQLSHMTCALVTVKEANLFIAVWAIPSALVPELIEAACMIDTKFYQEEKIITMSVNEKQLYPLINIQVY